MPTKNVNLTDHQSSFIHGLLKEERYKNASEVVRAGLRLLENYEEEEHLKLERLRAEVQKGVDSIDEGRYIEINSSEELDAVFDDIQKEAEKRFPEENGHVTTPPAQ